MHDLNRSSVAAHLELFYRLPVEQKFGILEPMSESWRRCHGRQ